MAYSLRYWYNNKLTDGKVIRLEIYKKDSTAAAMEIGDVVQDISLNIDGGEDNIDAPIVSTSLVMTFCDAYDHPEAEVKKCGNYAEFYTPDATLWKVVLLCKDKGSSSFRTLWGGYVTPDSYEEDLTYRGSVTIVARDNIGHMADFPFDAEGDGYGTISFREVIEGAWAKIESPMSLVFHDEWMQTEGVSALDTRMNVSAFEDKSWHEAVEAALYVYGAVMRFIGDNNVKVSPLRYMPNYGGSVTHSEPVFMTGATRMLTPAVKRIEETASYELEAGAVIPKIEASDYTGETGTYRCKIDGIEIDGETFSTNEHDAPIWPISTLGFNDWYNGALATTLFFNVDAYDIGYFSDYRGLSDEIKRYMYIAANQVDARFVRVYKAMQSSDFVIKMQFGKPVRLNREYELEQSYGSFNLKEITYAITMEQNGVTTYYHGGDYWSATRKELRISFDATKENSVAEFPVAIGQNIGDALFCFEIVKIEYAQVGPSNETYGLYACIQSLSFDVPENISLLQTNRVNTNYNEENNVIITRDPAIAPAYNTTFLPSVIKNGIFYAAGLAYKPAKAWAFAGDTPQQMAVYNHLQLLAYYAKPNNVIEGSIVNWDVSRFAHIWQFEGKEHILVSGRYNFINGYIEGAILREFARYESLWGSTGGTQLPATETSSETNVEASASSSSSANTYENTTVVNIGIGGGGSGASYLGDLKDVDTTAVVGGSVLYFNGTQWVDKTLQMVLNELKQLGDWFYKTEDGKSIGTKYNLFSEKEISANGLNLGSGTSGGGGSTTLDGLIDVNLSSPQNGNILVFNGTHWVNKPQSELVPEVDLSDYYTKQQTQNAITSALSPYVKATDADGKYAALASFNALQSSFDRLYSALNDDTSGVINTWNEVVDFVNEYSGSEDLSTILGKMNTDINARVKVSDFDTWKTDVFNPLSVTVTNLGKKVDTNTANINKLLGWFNVDADGNLFTTYNFYSTKEISANGISQGTSGEGNSNITAVLDKRFLGKELADDNSVVFNAYATNEIYKATQGNASRIGVLESQVGQLTTQRTKVSVSDLLTTGTKIATITVDGVAHEVKGDFLPTSGGEISGDTDALKIVRNTNGYSAITYYNTQNGATTLLGVMGFDSHGEPSAYRASDHVWRTLIHSGNVGEYAFTPRAQIISNTDADTLITNGVYLNATGNGSGNSNFSQSYSIFATFAQSEKYLVQLSIGYNTFYFRRKIDTWDDWREVIHSGNIGSQSVNESLFTSCFKKTMTYAASMDLNTLNTGGMAVNYGSIPAWVNGPTGMHYGLVLNLKAESYNNLQGQLAWDIVHNSTTDTTRYLYWRASDDGTFTEAKWHQIAFTDSNVASATKLEKKRKLWGNDFDGTADIAANKVASMYRVGFYDNAKDDGASTLGYIGRANSTNDLFIYYGTESNLRIIGGNGSLILNSSGNVTIGSSDLAGTDYKLYVDGAAIAKSIKLNQICIESDSLGKYDSARSGEINRYSGDLRLQYNSAFSVTMCYGGGNVGIGTINPLYKLDVAGYIRTKGFFINRKSDNVEAFEISNVDNTNGFDIRALGGYSFLSFSTSTTTPSEKMRILGNGNVLIGTTTDEGHKLHVAGRMKATSATTESVELYHATPFIDFHFNNSIVDFTSRIIESSSGVLNINASLYALFKGNVGVGTSNPTSALDVSRNASEPAIALHYSHSRDNNLFGAKIALVDNGYYHGNLVFRVKSTASANESASLYTDAMTIVGNNGNVLIGTATADESGAKLQVDGGCITIKNGTAKTYSYIRSGNYSVNTARLILGTCYGYGVEVDALAIYHGNVGIGINTPQYRLDVAGTLHSSGAVTFDSTLTIAGATTHNGIAYFGGTTYYINTSGNAHFNAISGSSLQVDSAAFNGTIHSNEYSGNVAKWSITADGAASFASLSNGGLLETSTLRVSSTSTFTGKTNHNGGIGATSLNVSGTSTLLGHVGIGISPHSTYALYVDGSICCGPIDGGTASLGALCSDTHVPNLSETYNLGSDSYRWASIYGVGADLSGNLTVNGTLNTNDIDGSDIYITASGNLYLHTLTGYVGVNSQRWAIDGYGNYKGQSLYINPRDNDNEIITDNNKKKTHGFPREEVAVFVNGDIAATGEISANALNQGSDIRFKHQLGDIALDLDTIANAPMFRFTWTNKENSRVQIGTSAQYWKDSARELVSVDKDDFHRLDYATLGVLIGVTLGKTVKNHEDRIKELETKVESLEAENRRLRYEC